MSIEISDHLSLTIHGFSGIAVNKDYTGLAFQLSGKMWQVVKEKGLGNKGKNIWVYESSERVFAGVELNDSTILNTGLESKKVVLTQYARYKHVGPYQLIKHSGQKMIEELKRKGYAIGDTYIEIYGHWTKDESKLETDLIMSLE